jgi:hypothetical protein
MNEEIRRRGDEEIRRSGATLRLIEEPTDTESSDI